MYETYEYRLSKFNMLNQFKSWRLPSLVPEQVMLEKSGGQYLIRSFSPNNFGQSYLSPLFHSRAQHLSETRLLIEI